MSGVKIYGELHEARLREAFYHKQGIIFRIITILATGLINQGNREVMLKQIRELEENMFPEDPEIKAKRTQALEELISEESQKEYKVS